MASPPSEIADRCGSCGHDLRAGARFCDACGVRVTPQQPDGEHKHVTVLFADVVGSMQLAARLDAERLQEIMHELFNRAGAVVQRYQGTVDKFTGDGLMALFGAPRALEDHALRACIAALEIQSAARELAEEVLNRDGVALHLRVGLNSGDVIAGEIGSGPGSYTAIGHPVGIAQRMEAAAAPGGALCSMSTAQLVEDAARLGPVREIAVKGSVMSVPARELLGVESDRIILGRNEGLMLGRDAELARLGNLFAARRGSLVGIVGGPGLGKSRLIREFSTIAADEGAQVVVARCEAHTTKLAFRAVTRLLRAMFGVEGQSDDDARRQTLAACAGLQPYSMDAQILFDAMGIADPDAPAVQIGADGRRRRLVELMGRTVRAHPTRLVFVLDDAHWIDEPSDAVLAEFAAMLAPTTSIFITTYRPEFHGALHRHSQHTLTLQPLTKTKTLELLGQILGTDPSLAGVADRIADAAAGYPFFVEEIVRDLAGRGALSGSRGSYRLITHIGEISVPATVQAVLAARIDRLSADAKAILNSAAVIGTRFDVETLQVLRTQALSPGLVELVAAELIDQTEFVPRQRYCFHHPLVRTVAYDSQLSGTRSRAHRNLAAAIEARDPHAADENAALIATHLEAAGDLPDAYRWHMRAAEWLRPRDVRAAGAEWDSARRVADQLSDNHDEVIKMRVAPRAMLMSKLLYTGDAPDTDERYAEFHDLATAAGDLKLLALGTAGRIFSLTVNGFRISDTAPLLPQLDALAASPGLDAETRGIVLNSLAYARFATCGFEAALLAANAILDLVPEMPPIEAAPALALRGTIETCLGDHEIGRRHLEEGSRQARSLPAVNYASVHIYWAVMLTLGLYEAAGLVDSTRDALSRAEAFGDACGIVIAQWAYGTVLLRAGQEHREEAVDVLRRARTNILKHRVGVVGLTTIVRDLAVDDAGRGARSQAIDELRALQAQSSGCSPVFGVVGSEALVQLLVERGGDDDLAEARRIVEQWQDERPGIPALDLWWLKSRVLLARAEDRSATFAEEAAHYLQLCERLDARGRLAEARRLAGESTVQAGMV
ncbi:MULTISPECIES: adenylate/guanylate cyclase domain-containing protein [unclassified Mycobacterium]|uniref:ATP-binding protein n=1 Tax=unclassified Mycobacterium TaxID=2642494 RepID=UPI00073FB795|nr:MULTISPECIES: adenylate/guanylate cyclase domain-containing protein [unclassified Mycobacterium]KUH82177.1 adenylyl cyclase [Mycobacterium sp. GA-0227b]KUH86564.1 adenylyl cyclase [Mycobacterium sp. GA-1999]KUH88191.1 adenylyl cyclase [Mycobacterium sp. IS-1556]